jgi:hypothetical protein
VFSNEHLESSRFVCRNEMVLAQQELGREQDRGMARVAEPRVAMALVAGLATVTQAGSHPENQGRLQSHLTPRHGCYLSGCDDER